MNVIRCTVVDDRGGVSFVVHADALPALVAACTTSPDSLGQLLDRAETYYSGLKDYVLSGLALFDEQNVPGRYNAVHFALGNLPPYQQPVFRVVDDVTREASLQPVKAGAVIFNLKAKRIVQMVNSYREIKRSGYARVFDGRHHTEKVFRYRLPEEWALVP
ncbi:MAG: hypothetical protein HYS09_08720 [Chloroflexi bacterium]|nr:hypothetical protein [Chloroflexota bacterium]